jgi:hypothetical protein
MRMPMMVIGQLRHQSTKTVMRMNRGICLLPNNASKAHSGRESYNEKVVSCHGVA